MVEFKGALANLIKKVSFVVVNVEDESSEETDVLRVEIAEELTITGSNPLDNGEKMIHKDNVVYVAGDDIEAFQNALKPTDVEGEFLYEGNLKLDVSKPKFRVVNGEVKITKSPKLWLVSVKFNKRGNALRNDTQAKGRNAILKLFGQKVPDETTGATTPEVTASKQSVTV